MNPSSQTGQTAPASPASPSNQGNSSQSSSSPTTPSPTNPFAMGPSGGESSAPETNTPSQGEQVVPDGAAAATQSQESQNQNQSQQQASTPVTQLAMTPDDFRKTLVDGILAAQQQQNQRQPQQPAAAPQPMSPEQFRQHYEIPAVDANVYEAILGTAPDSPARVEALDNLLTGYMRAGVKMGQDLLQAQLGQLKQTYDARLTPLMTAHVQQQERAIVERFSTAYPDLKEEMVLVNEVKDAMIARGAKFSSEQEMFKAVGDATRQLVSRLRGGNPAAGQGNQSGGSQTGPAPQQRPAARTMTPSLQGGRGGNASSKSQPSIAEQVFGGS